jgi:hypothetical protein
MKRILAAGIAFVVVFVGGMAAHAATSRSPEVAGRAAIAGTPEVDRASATTQLTGKYSRPTFCVAEDGGQYTTYRGTATGSESQVLPDPTDYSLAGPLTVSGIIWTINLTTGRGVLTGTIKLSTSAGGSSEYVGKVTLISQGIPVANGSSVPARGWIVAAFTPPDETVTPGDDSLLANVEFNLITLAGVPSNGQFGDAAGSGSLGIPDYSAVTNVAPRALDGTC